MGYVTANSLVYLFGRWWGILLILAMVVGVTSLAIAGLNQMTAEGDARRTIKANARALWMQECPHAIDQCAISWDYSYTLRAMYAERVD